MMKSKVLGKLSLVKSMSAILESVKLHSALSESCMDKGLVMIAFLFLSCYEFVTDREPVLVKYPTEEPPTARAMFHARLAESGTENAKREKRARRGE